MWKKGMLVAARHKYRDDVDVTERLVNEGNEKEINGIMATLSGESVFRNDGNVENNELDKWTIYLDLCDDLRENIKSKLQKHIE